MRARYDLLIVGAGPAGLAAAVAAARGLERIAIIDDNPSPGGQIWRGASREGARWIEGIRNPGIEVLSGTTLASLPEPGVALVEDATGAREISFRKLLLATGARERFLPFPGWTLPSVVGAGGLQAMVRSGLPIEGKTVVVAGSGPLLLAVAAHLKEAGASIPVIAEQASFSALARFGAGLAREPGKLLQAVKLRLGLRGTRYITGCWPVEAGESGVRLRAGSGEWEERCDYLACGFGLTPNLELAWLLGCACDGGFVTVDDQQRTSVENVYAAGEITGIGGVERAVIEGRIAGLAAAGRLDETRSRARRFAHALTRAFALRPELRTLANDDTIVCRCEDVRYGQLKEHGSWRAAKLHTRCGMGPCQGRVCGAATEFIFGWSPESARPPVFAARVSTLAVSSEEK